MTRQNFPKTVKLGSDTFTLRLMSAQDRTAILTFANQLSENDLLFMRRDVTKPEAVDAWISDIQAEHATSILVELNDGIVAYGTLYFNQLFWNRHLGEIRVLVSSPYRGHGIGTRLTRELMKFAQEMELEKIITYMAVDDRGARTVVEELGFKPEAILADWVKTRDERHHDLLIMSTSLVEMQA
jgi:RimJ/RimL family protein N-acetyltransferase